MIPPARAVENASTSTPRRSKSPRIAAVAPSIPNKKVPARSTIKTSLRESYCMGAARSAEARWPEIIQEE